MNSTRSINNLHLLNSLFITMLLFFSPALGLNLDGTLLLSFKHSILSDPLSVLDNWDYNDATPCSWTGVKCSVVENAPDNFRVITLSLPNSKLVGIIPEDIALIPHLRTLDLSNNFLNGTLPNSLMNASELEVLSLSSNAISGAIPQFFSGPKSLKLLNLSENALTGEIPQSITSLHNLTMVSLSRNYLTGQVPINIQSLEFFDLSSNSLNGSLPIEFGGENLKYLNLSSNKLSGLVPQEFAQKIPSNATVDLSFNDLSGEITDSFPALSNQRTQSFAGNTELCGKPVNKLCAIPSTFAPPNATTNTSSSPAIAAIPKVINSKSSSDFSTATPNAAQNNSHISPGAIAGIVIVPLAGIGILAVIFIYTHQRRKRKASIEENKQVSKSTFNSYEFEKDSGPPPPSKEAINLNFPLTWNCLRTTNEPETSTGSGSDRDDPEPENRNRTSEHFGNVTSLVMVDGETELDPETLFKASAYVLGSTGPSIVYKAVLRDGAAFAVRRIGDCGYERMKEFESQIRAVAKMRHPNLVRVRGFYWGDDEKLVICDYVSNGSLANVGYRKIGSSPYHLPFETRLKIAKGVARGLTYIHDKKNVHGNIKPSNILLTPDMEPIISDLGVHWLIHGKKHGPKSQGSARHFGSKRTSSSSHDHDLHGQLFNRSPNYIAPVGFVGCTSPYHAPESLDNLKPNPKWDVYSFGILLLELLTGKVFSDRELGQWAAGSVAEDPTRVMRMADAAVRGDVAGREESMMALFRLGFSCASLAPSKRPCMRDALHVLEKIPCLFTLV